MVRLAGFEPTTPWFVAKESIVEKSLQINILSTKIRAIEIADPVT